MGTPSNKRRGKGGKKVRVAFRQNRSSRSRKKNWTQETREAEGHEIDTVRSESVVAKGSLSRQRTIVVRDKQDDGKGLHRGMVLSTLGLFAEVDDGERIHVCTVRRILRTRLIKERHPVTVGDRVKFRTAGSASVGGVIEVVEPRRGQLRRLVGRRIHTIAANIDQALIVSSANNPPPRPNLIDRYIIASHAGEIDPVICMNKVDLDQDGSARELLQRYAELGYVTLCTSTVTGDGMEALRDALAGKSSAVAGQSGVGKSSLINAIQPNLRLKTGDVIQETGKGKHTTSTSTLLKLDFGGYVVDTPGIRSFDLSTVQRHEFEMYYREFVEHVPNCKFPDCTHTHEDNCAVKRAVESGKIHPERYESYVRLFQQPPNARRGHGFD